MPRVQPLKKENVPELKPIFEAGEKIMGFTPNDGLTMAHQPNILKSFLGLVQSIYAPSSINGSLKRLIGIIVSSSAGCIYCQAHASNGAFHQNVSKDKIEAVWDFQTSSLFSEAEKAALNLAVKSSIVPNAAEDEDFKKLKQYFSEKEIVEIVAVISMYAFLNRWNSTVQTELEEKPKSFFQNLNLK